MVWAGQDLSEEWIPLPSAREVGTRVPTVCGTSQSQGRCCDAQMQAAESETSEERRAD